VGFVVIVFCVRDAELNVWFGICDSSSPPPFTLALSYCTSIVNIVTGTVSLAWAWGFLDFTPFVNFFLFFSSLCIIAVVIIY